LEQAALLDVATDAIFVKDIENHISFWGSGKYVVIIEI